MKELHGSATGETAAAVEECLALLEAVENYPTWYPEVVREVDVLERDEQGRPARARTTLHLSAGPLVRDFRLLLAVQIEGPRMVRLTRVRHDPSDQEEFQVTWRLEQAARTRIHLELDANLSVPRLLPIGGLGESLADGFVDAAIRALDTSPR